MSLEQKLAKIIKKNISKKDENVKDPLSMAQYIDLRKEFEHLVSESMEKSGIKTSIRFSKGVIIKPFLPNKELKELLRLLIIYCIFLIILFNGLVCIIKYFKL